MAIIVTMFQQIRLISKRVHVWAIDHARGQDGPRVKNTQKKINEANIQPS